MLELLVAVGNPTTRFSGAFNKPWQPAVYFCSYCAILTFFKHRTGTRRLRRFIVRNHARHPFAKAMHPLERPEARLPKPERGVYAASSSGSHQIDRFANAVHSLKRPEGRAPEAERGSPRIWLRFSI